MKITITGSLGNISKPLAQNLVAAGHTVIVISSSADKVKGIEALGAKAAIGSVEDVAFVSKAFTGADAIYTMVPPTFDPAKFDGFRTVVGEVFAQAIKASGVKKVVNLSSIGAHLPSGTGPIAGLHDVEHSLNALDGVAVKHLRAGFFYVNFYNNIDMVKHAGILGANYPANVTIEMVHPADIAAAEELQGSFTGKNIRYVVSDEHTNTECAAILGTAIGKPGLPWVEFTDEQTLDGMVKAGMPEVIAKNYVEMGNAVKSGKLFEDYLANRPATLARRKLEDFAKNEFAAAYNK